MTRSTLFAALLPLGLLVGGTTERRAADSIAPSDNSNAAGTLRGGILTIAL